MATTGQQLGAEAEQANLLAKAFTSQFYDNLGKPSTAPLYNYEMAQLNIEGIMFIGVPAIVETQTKRFANTMFAVTTCDGQFISPNQVLINVIGQLTSEGQDKPLGFTHVFVLLQAGGNWQITNEVFRLTLHNF